MGKGALKAVLTEHNQSWYMRDLLGELEKEETLMNAYQQLHLLARQASHRLTQHPDAALSAALGQAQQLLQGREPSLQALRLAGAELEKQLKITE